VERRVDEQDQRYTRIYLTPAGMELHEEMHEVVAEIVEATIAPLSEDDQRELTRLLGLLTENIAAATDAVQAESDHSTLEMASDETEEDCEL
jgi:DNA-binding MarR family transcriptional regulator